MLQARHPSVVAMGAAQGPAPLGLQPARTGPAPMNLTAASGPATVPQADLRRAQEGQLRENNSPAIIQFPATSGPPTPPQAEDAAPLLCLQTETRKLEDLNDAISRLQTGNERIRRPKTLRTKLKPHQMEALKWLLAKESVPEGLPRGGVLADDMGLGKTASVIALLLKSKEKEGSMMYQSADDATSSEEEEDECDKREEARSASGKPKGRTLLICPPTLMDHWEQEVMKHVVAQGLSVSKHHGPQRTTDPDKLARLYDLVITTYGLVRQGAEKDAVFKVSWERVVLDEAHEVRNPESLGCKAVASLEARCRWCVTGTPLHNTLLDLHGLFKVLNCWPFSDREAWECLFGVSEMRNPRMWELLKRAMIMRRLKSDYDDGKSVALPRLNVQRVRIVLDVNEREAYRDLAQSSNRHLDDISGNQDPKFPKKCMYSILLLRQVCNHPHLITEKNINEDLDLDEPTIVYDSREDGEVEGEQKRRRSIIQIEEEWNGTKKDLQKYFKCSFDDPLFKPERPSTKMEKLLEIILRVLAQNEKAVVVSQWTKMLDLISAFLNKNNVSHKTISGDVPNEGRSKVVKDFNDSSNALKVLLLSLKAGGVGLNLVGGNHLILFDPHWNPQLERQACDRVHRMGQPKKDVYIYKFVVADTIEEVIEEKQEAKLHLAQTVLDNPSPRNIRQLVNLADDEKALADMLQFEARRGNKRKADF